MTTRSTNPRGTHRTQTYLPEAVARDEILDFAELIRELEIFLAQSSSKAALVDPKDQARPIPDEIFRILDQVTNALAAGQGITIVPQGMTMTTQQAADFLGISRPTLVRLLEAGDIPYDQPGRHRGVRCCGRCGVARRVLSDVSAIHMQTLCLDSTADDVRVALGARRAGR